MGEEKMKKDSDIVYHAEAGMLELKIHRDGVINVFIWKNKKEAKLREKYWFYPDGTRYAKKFTTTTRRDKNGKNQSMQTTTMIQLEGQDDQ